MSSLKCSHGLILYANKRHFFLFFFFFFQAADIKLFCCCFVASFLHPEMFARSNEETYLEAISIKTITLSVWYYNVHVFFYPSNISAIFILKFNIILLQVEWELLKMVIV